MKDDYKFEFDKPIERKSLYVTQDLTPIYAISIVDEEVFHLKRLIIDDRDRAIALANDMLKELHDENNFINRNYEKEVAISTLFDDMEMNLTENCSRHSVRQGFLFA